MAALLKEATVRETDGSVSRFSGGETAGLTLKLCAFGVVRFVGCGRVARCAYLDPLMQPSMELRPVHLSTAADGGVGVGTAAAASASASASASATRSGSARNVEFYFNDGVRARMRGDLEAAYAAYSKALTLNPRHFPSQLNRGYLLDRQGQLQEALADYTAACELDGCNGFA